MKLPFLILNALRILVVVDALASWFQQEGGFPRRCTKPRLDPVYDPMRDFFRDFTGGIDPSPLVALLLIQLVQLGLEKAGIRESK